MRIGARERAAPLAGRGPAGADPVVGDELPVRNARQARHEVGDRAQPRDEPRGHDELRAVPIEGGDGALDALARNVPAEARIEELLAVDLPGAEDEGIADEDSGEAGDDHQGQRPAAADQPAARDQGHVLGQRHAQTTRDQHEENADVGGRPVEVDEEMKEPVLQAAPPRLGRSSEASRSWTGTASSTPDAVAPSLQDDDDRMANPQTASRLKPAAS